MLEIGGNKLNFLDVTLINNKENFINIKGQHSQEEHLISYPITSPLKKEE